MIMAGASIMIIGTVTRRDFSSTGIQLRLRRLFYLARRRLPNSTSGELLQASETDSIRLLYLSTSLRLVVES